MDLRKAGGVRFCTPAKRAISCPSAGGMTLRRILEFFNGTP